MVKDTVDAIKRMITGRVFAYNQVFDPKNQYTKAVLRDLAHFCRAHETTFNSDPRLHAVLEGRREVWLRIQEQLKLSIDEIYELHKVNQLMLGEKK